jgi:outer membrane lipoprotein-sorting protein
MLRSTIARFVAATALLTLAVPALSQGVTPAKKAAAANATVKDVRACMAKNLVDRGALRDLSLDVFDDEGKIRSLRMRLFWKPSKTGGTRVNLRLMEPMAMAGSSYLLLQEGATEEVYFYLPGADRSLRITGQNMSEPLWGTDFSYGEIKQVLGLLWAGDTTRAADATVSDRPAYVLETHTRAEDTGYRKIMSAVDQAACVLLKTDFHVKADQPPRKVLTADLSTLMQADKYWTVLGYTMADQQRKTRTVLSLTDLSFNESLSEKLFQPKTFFSEQPPK